MTSLDDYRLLGKSGLRVSPLCLGTMTFGEQWAFGSNFEESKKVFDSYYEKGGNFFDTANLYTNGESERMLGQMISEKRSSVVVATKYSLNPHGTAQGGPSSLLLSGNSRKSLAENVDLSLKRMGIGSIDLLYVHAWEYRTPVNEVMRAIDDAVRAGKIHYAAISDTPSWVISQANTIADLRGWTGFIGLQTRYSLLERSFEFEYAAMCGELGLSAIPWGAIAEGFLSGKYIRGKEVQVPRGSISEHVKHERNWLILEEVVKISQEIGRTPSQVAINWLLVKGTLPLVGAKNSQQLEENLKALEFSLSPSQMERLDAVSAPSNVPFPQNFSNQPFVQNILSGGNKIQHPAQYNLFKYR